MRSGGDTDGPLARDAGEAVVRELMVSVPSVAYRPQAAPKQAAPSLKMRGHRSAGGR